MNVINKSIVLTDRLMKDGTSGFSKLETQNQEVVGLDPVQLFSRSDWTRFDEDLDVINEIYSYVFNEVVVENKKLICFWPLAEQFGCNWLELNSMCSANGYDLEIYKSGMSGVDNYGFSGEILRSWKKFVYFLVESLMEDIHLNEEFVEIATLTSDKGSFILYKLVQEGKELYTFAFEAVKKEMDRGDDLESTAEENVLSPFTSFQEMLKKLLNCDDLSRYRTKFSDPQLEKAYFNVLVKEFKTENLIENWILTYSMN